MSPGTLHIVATPIGNLEDASPRSLDTLRRCELIACEDTRVTRGLLARHGVQTRLVSLHEHNERRVAARLVEELRAGREIALVSDAGTPAISDPGAWLVSEAHRAGVRVSPVPGPSAAIAAYSAAGFASAAFLFLGFLPASGGERARALEEIDQPWPVVLYEAPHRIRRTLQDLLARLGPRRQVLVARELTKKFEELARLGLADAVAWVEADSHREQGEYVLVIEQGNAAPARAPEPDAVLDILLESLPPSDAARLAARITGAPKNALYRKALGRAK